jgi:hypothetical protein
LVSGAVYPAPTIAILACLTQEISFHSSYHCSIELIVGILGSNDGGIFNRVARWASSLFLVMALVPQYLGVDEEAQIHRQFQGDTWRRNDQVLWSGIMRDEAQRWTDEHEIQTLTTAMGPLMDLSHPLCLRNQISSDAWSKYVKGASAIFVWYISRGERVTVLSPPPLERFHPSGQTNYQAIEEPIVKGMLGTSAVSRIEMVHPTVKGAENISYQIWPVDNSTTWTTRFGELNTNEELHPILKWRYQCSCGVRVTGRTRKPDYHCGSRAIQAM